MASKAELKGRVSLNNKNFNAKIRRMRRSSRRWGAALTKAAGVAAKGVAAVTAAAGAATFAVAKLVNSTANYSREVTQLQSRMGLSVKQTQKYMALAKGFQVETEAMADAIKEAQMRLDEYAVTGAGPAKESMERLGISQKQAGEMVKDNANLLPKLIKKMQALDTQAGKMRVADELFGGTGAEQLTNMINASAGSMDKFMEKVQQIGGMTKGQQQIMQKYSQSVFLLKKAFSGIRNKLVIAFVKQFQGGLDQLTNKIIEFKQKGKFTEWAATAAGAVNNFIEKSRMLFAQLESVVVPIFKILKREGELVWDGIKLAGALAWRGLQGIINSAVANIRKGFVVLQSWGSTTWNLVKEAAHIAFRAIQKGGVIAFRTVMIAAEESINKIIQAYNNIPGLKNIEFVQFEGIDKAALKIEDLNKKIAESKNSIKRGGDAWQPIADGAQKVKEIEAEQQNIEAEINQQIERRVGPLDKIAGRIERNTDAIMQGKDIQDAQNKLVKKEGKIRKQHGAIAKGIAKFQQAALNAERKRTAEAKKGKGELEKQEAALKRMNKTTEGGRLRAAFTGITQLARGEKSAPNVRRNKEKKDDRLEKEQIKLQRQIAQNTAKKQGALAW